jgi:glutamyl-tRNA synthetase
MRETDNEKLVALLVPFLESKHNISISTEDRNLLKRGMNGLKTRAKTMVELAEMALFYMAPQPLDENARKFLDTEGLKLLALITESVLALPETSWSEDQLENHMREFAEKNDLKLGKLAQPLRAALTGKSVSPSVFEIMHVFGKDKTLERLKQNR